MTKATDSRGAEIERSFIRLLIGDVLAARERLAATDTQRHRRDMIRVTFAAIEGVTWIYREHVRQVANDMGLLTPIADLALRERTFTVSEQGAIIEQVRFVTLPTIIRLTTRQAQLIEPTVGIDFQAVEWAALRSAIDVRNRVTHPKGKMDFEVTSSDLTTVASSFAWLLGSTETVMAAINVSFRTHIAALRDIVAALKRGDEQALADYRAALTLGDD